MATRTQRTVRPPTAQGARTPGARSAPAPGASPIGDGAVLERLIRMRGACHALAVELADARRRLRAAEAELHRLKRSHGHADGAPLAHAHGEVAERGPQPE